MDRFSDFKLGMAQLKLERAGVTRAASSCNAFALPRFLVKIYFISSSPSSVNLPSYSAVDMYVWGTVETSLCASVGGAVTSTHSDALERLLMTYDGLLEPTRPLQNVRRRPPRTKLGRI